jgi:D-arabinose 1-dehydrogenase-like Zn-dependent alcohol dehydrogenase
MRMGVDVDGAFAEFVLRPTAALIVPRAPVAPPVLAVLTDAVATPLHGLKRVAKLQPGETLVVLGIGGLGSNAVQLGKAMGARVIAVTRSEAKLRLARELGADETVAADDGDPVAAVKGLTGGHGPDVVIQCVGSALVDEQAIAMGGPGGRVVLIGASLDHFRARAVEIFWRELAVLGSRGFVPDDIRDAIDLYLDGTLTVDHLVGALRPLDQADQALEDLRAGRVLRSVLVP